MSPTFSLPDAFLTDLKNLLPRAAWSQDASDLEAYGKDWTKHFSPLPSLIVFPASTEEVAGLIKLCAKYNVPVVPSGGRTGLSGGAVASRGEVVVSLSRMQRLDAVDTFAQTVRVQAGVVTQTVHEHCAPHGLTWPVDFASKGSSQVGGNISTNAGGVRVIRYGLTRHWVLGLQVVTAGGEVLELNGALEKNQTGLDLRQLFIGSEGTLGIVTEATLKLTTVPGEAEIFFFALSGFPEVLKLFQLARREHFTINAFEMLGDNCLEAVLAHRKLTSPFTGKRNPYYVLLEVERPETESAKGALEKWLGSLFENGNVADGVLAQNPKEARTLWELREGISESIMAWSLVHKHDISVPLCRLEGFVGEFQKTLRDTYHGFELFLFGHIGDGNMHINIRKPAEMTKEAFLAECKLIDRTLFELVRKYEGSVSAEHGIGLLKKEALGYSRSEEQIALMRVIKKAMDPRGILNPGKIFD